MSDYYPRHTILSFTAAQPGWQIVFSSGKGVDAETWIDPLVGWALVETIRSADEIPPFERSLQPVWLEDGAYPVWSGERNYEDHRVIEVLAPGQKPSVEVKGR